MGLAMALLIRIFEQNMRKKLMIKFLKPGFSSLFDQKSHFRNDHFVVKCQNQKKTNGSI